MREGVGEEEREGVMGMCVRDLESRGWQRREGERVGGGRGRESRQWERESERERVGDGRGEREREKERERD